MTGTRFPYSYIQCQETVEQYLEGIQEKTVGAKDFM